MKLLKQTFYLILTLLLLTVIKSIAGGRYFHSGYMVAIIINCFQFLSFLTFIFFVLFSRIFSRILPGRKVVLYALFFFGAIIGLLEFISGFYLNHPTKIPSFLFNSYCYYYDYYDMDIIQFDTAKSVYDYQLFYTLKPRSVYSFENREFRSRFEINSLGLRDTESAIHEPEVICLGDSYTMGWGVEQDETFPKLLEKTLNRRVLNAGVASYGTAREILSLKSMDTSKLKYLVLQYCGNDKEENEAYIKSNYQLHISSKPAFDSLCSLNVQARRYFPLKYSMMIGQLFIKSSVNKIMPAFSSHFDRLDSLSNIKQQANNFLKILLNTGINFEKVVPIVMINDTYIHQQNDFIKNIQVILNTDPRYAGLKSRIKIIDLSKQLLIEDYYKLDKHFKPSGHRKIATALAVAILSSNQ